MAGVGKSPIAIAALVSALLLIAARAPAQELEPRTYSNTAVGVNTIGGGVALSSGNVLLDPALPIEGLDGDLALGFVQYLRAFGLLRQSAKVKVLVPFTDGNWTGTFEGQPARRDATGFGDLRATFEWNFVGAPAMTAAELRDYDQRTIVGASLRVVAPTGDYDNTELINLGSNRWSYRLELGVSRSFAAWAVEGAFGVWLYGNNDDFVEGNYLQQDDLWYGTGGVSYSFRPGFWIGAGIGYGSGGRTSVNGIPRDNRQENWRIGVTMSYPFNKQHGISVTIGTGFNQGFGADFDTIAVGYGYAWGKI